MIEAPELRIGNYIKNPLGEIVQVTAKMIVEQKQSDLANVPYLWKITLTKEWLLRFGFTRCIGWDDMVYWHIGDFTLWENEKGFEFENSQIETVHRLQNLYHAVKNQELKASAENKASTGVSTEEGI